MMNRRAFLGASTAVAAVLLSSRTALTSPGALMLTGAGATTGSIPFAEIIAYGGYAGQVIGFISSLQNARQMRQQFGQINLRLNQIEGKIDLIAADVKKLPGVISTLVEQIWQERLKRVIAAKKNELDILVAARHSSPRLSRELAKEFEDLEKETRGFVYELKQDGPGAYMAVSYGFNVMYLCHKYGGAGESDRAVFRARIGDMIKYFEECAATFARIRSEQWDAYEREAKRIDIFPRQGLLESSHNGDRATDPKCYYIYYNLDGGSVDIPFRWRDPRYLSLKRSGNCIKDLKWDPAVYKYSNDYRILGVHASINPRIHRQIATLVRELNTIRETAIKHRLQAAAAEANGIAVDIILKQLKLAKV